MPVYDAKRLPADAEADRSGVIQKRSRDDEAALPVDGGGIIAPGGLDAICCDQGEVIVTGGVVCKP